MVEDQKDVRLLVTRSLNAYGYRVLATANAEEALACAQAHDGLDRFAVNGCRHAWHERKRTGRPAGEIAVEIRVLYMSGYPESVIAHKGILDPGI